MFLQWFKRIHIVNFKQCSFLKVPQNMALSASCVLDKLADGSREFGWPLLTRSLGRDITPNLFGGEPGNLPCHPLDLCETA